MTATRMDLRGAAGCLHRYAEEGDNLADYSEVGCVRRDQKWFQVFVFGLKTNCAVFEEETFDGSLAIHQSYNYVAIVCSGLCADQHQVPRKHSGIYHGVPLYTQKEGAAAGRNAFIQREIAFNIFLGNFRSTGPNGADNRERC